MSALQPNNEPGLLIDEFIKYAQAHLKTVGGSIGTLSSYPAALGAPLPGVIAWTGFLVEGAKQSAAESIPDTTPTLETNYKLGRPEGSPPDIPTSDDEDFTIPTAGIVRGNQVINEGPMGKFNKGTDWAPLITQANTSFGGSAIIGDYSGYSGGPLSADDTIKKIYLPVLNKVHADKSKGIRLLMAAQTQNEGFFPANPKRDWHPGASLSFLTNNPGNVGTDGNNVGKFDTLDKGVQAQWNKVLGPVFENKSPYYKTSDTLFQYLSTYAPVMAKKRDGTVYKTGNDPTSYTNFVINFFKGSGITITANTTLAQINSIK
jgi:hypothetical protein